MAVSSHPYFWSPQELETLEQCYLSGGGLYEAQQLIPQKQRTTIAAQASRRGWTTPRPRLNRQDEQDDDSAGY